MARMNTAEKHALYAMEMQGMAEAWEAQGDPDQAAICRETRKVLMAQSELYAKRAERKAAYRKSEASR